MKLKIKQLQDGAEGIQKEKPGLLGQIHETLEMDFTYSNDCG